MKTRILPADADVVIDSDSLNIKCIVKVCVHVFSKKDIRRLCECNISGDAEYKRKASVITVYYPTEEESLFEIAKRFHTTSAKLALDNNLAESAGAMPSSPASISGIKRLIIK